MVALLHDALKTGCPMSAKIINRGHGPEIAVTRITVYDVLDYARQEWHRDRIAALFRRLRETSRLLSTTSTSIMMTS